jgi:hypothetical protein
MRNQTADLPILTRLHDVTTYPLLKLDNASKYYWLSAGEVGFGEEMCPAHTEA